MGEYGSARNLLLDFFGYFLYCFLAIAHCPIFYVVLVILCGVAVISLFWDLVDV